VQAAVVATTATVATSSTSSAAAHTSQMINGIKVAYHQSGLTAAGSRVTTSLVKSLQPAPSRPHHPHPPPSHHYHHPSSNNMTQGFNNSRAYSNNDDMMRPVKKVTKKKKLRRKDPNRFSTLNSCLLLLPTVFMMLSTATMGGPCSLFHSRRLRRRCRKITRKRLNIFVFLNPCFYFRVNYL